MKADPAYSTGEAIREGDSVRIGQLEGVIEFIMTSGSPGWADYWQAHGEGVMLAGPAFGKLYTKFHDEDLAFVGRSNG